jgi:hypothetical protein
MADSGCSCSAIFRHLYLRNDAGRSIHFRAGSDCSPESQKAAAALFDATRGFELPADRFGDLDPFLMAVAKGEHELRGMTGRQ